jgi:hypothetical protein
MASYTFAGIRAGLVSNLSSLGIQSKGYVLGSIMPPSIECFPGEVSYDGAMQRGHDELEWTVRVTWSITIDIATQEKLDAFLDPSGATSVKTLIESDPTLGGVVDDLHVSGASGYQVREIQGGTALSCDWTVTIIA